MKLWSSTLLAGVLVAAVPLMLHAQQQPIIKVDITDVTVYDSGQLGVQVITGGSGYTSAPNVEITGGGGSGATATATISGAVHSIQVTNNGGSGYTSEPDVIISAPPGGGVPAAATATIAGGRVIAVTVTNPGSGYTSAPLVSFSGGGGAGAGASASISGTVTAVTLTNPGSGYTTIPAVTFSGGGGTGAQAVATLSGTRFDPPNEAYGPTGVTIGITARGVGTFMRDSFRYSFFVNGESIGRTPEPIPPPQTFTAFWTPPQPGFYFLTVKIDDGVNEATSLPIRYFAEGTVVNNPVTNTIVPNGSSVVLKADATAGGGFIRSIQFYDNGIPIGEPDSTIPYSLIYTPPGGPGTVHNITAVATDNNFSLLPESPVVRLDVVNSIAPLPRSVITTPAHNSAVAIPTGDGFVPVVVDASSSGIVSKVELYIDGVLHDTSTNYPYTFTWQPKVVGKFRLVALVYDDKNNVVASTTSTSGSSTPQPTLVTVEAQESEAASTAKVYRGNFGTHGQAGGSRTAAIHRAATGEGTMIAFVSGVAEPQIYHYSGIDVEADGRMALVDGADTLVDGQMSPVAASGQFDNGRSMFTTTLVSGSSSYQGTGLITGAIGGAGDSEFVAIVGADGGMTIFARSGTMADAGQGTVRSNGSFQFATVRGGTFAGTIDRETGSLTGSLSGGPVTGNVSGAFEGTVAAASDGFLVNLSTRGPVGTGAKQLIAGFVIEGDAPKQVLLRGIGPSLAAYLPNAVSTPSLALFNAQQSKLADNQRWNGAPSIKAAASFAGAFSLNESSRDASLLETLTPGAYTVMMSSDGPAGVGLVELYDVDMLDPYSSRRVRNVSTRGEVGTGDNVIVAGFTISGTKPKRVLIRGVGPTLAELDKSLTGVLADPQLVLFDQHQVIVRTNDDWHVGNEASVVNTISSRVGAFALKAGSKDAVLLVTLRPGSYTAHLSGANNTTGIALIEVYEVD